MKALLLAALLVLFFSGSYCYVLKSDEDPVAKEFNRELNPQDMNSLLTVISKAIVEDGALYFLKISDEIEKNLPDDTIEMYQNMKQRLMTVFLALLENSDLKQDGRREAMMEVVLDTLKNVITDDDWELVLTLREKFKEKEQEIKDKIQLQQMNRVEDNSNALKDF